MRGIACLIVLVAHIVATSKYGIYASGSGKIGVWCFMLLSGFFLMLPLINDDKFNIKEFYIKKVFRIYPSYIIVLVLSVIVFYKSDLIMHIFGLKGFGHF